MSTEKHHITMNPYNTTFGKLTNTKDLTKNLISYFVMSADSNLNYEYEVEDGIGLAFITGKNEEEKMLPLWNFPLVLEDNKRNVTVVTDVRKYIKPTEDFLNIEELVRDKSGYSFTLINSLVTYQFVSGNFGRFRPVEKSFVLGYGLWLSNVIASAIPLSPLEKLNLEIIAQHYMYVNLVNGEVDLTVIKGICSKLANTKLSIPMKMDYIEELVSKLDSNANTITGLVNNLKKGLDPARASSLDVTVLVNIISTSWSGPNGSESVMMAVEHVPTWMAIYHTVLTNSSFKKSRIAMILDKSKRKLDMDAFVKFMTVFIKQHKY